MPQVEELWSPKLEPRTGVCSGRLEALNLKNGHPGATDAGVAARIGHERSDSFFTLAQAPQRHAAEPLCAASGELHEEIACKEASCLPSPVSDG